MEKTVIRDCVLYRGDCLEMFANLSPGSVSCCFTDPPYGISYVPNSRKVLEIPEMLANDDKPRLDFVPPIVKTVKNGGAIYLCTRFDVAPLWSNALTEAGARIKNPIYWIKDNMSKGDLRDRGNCVEIVLCAHVGRHLLRGKRVMNAWMIPRPEILFHPTPKPIELIRRCIVASSDFGDTVLEPFLGSGSTAIACALTGRKCICCEIDTRYFDLSCERIERTYKEIDSRLPGFEPLALEQQGSLFE